MASKAKTEDKSARSRRTADKAKAPKLGSKTSDPQKAFEQDLAAVREAAGVPGAPEVAKSAKEAAKNAAKEAKEAGVSPVAVLHSAPDGYGSGSGDAVTFASNDGA